MKLENFITSHTGLVHFVFSMLSLALGTVVLLSAKGTRFHKLMGRLYCIAMTITLATAFMTYRLFGTWGIFHWTALVSTLTLLCAMLPVLTRRPSNNYISLHLSFMYWSVMGVYAAFVSETLVRMPKVVVESGIPNHVFYTMTGVGTAMVMALAVYFFLQLKPRWDKQFSRN